jgi:hypothetical protein
MKKSTQTGSTHVIIIVILVIVILGALGFVFWNNFLNKPAAHKAASTTTTSTPASASTTTNPANLATLSIPELKVGLLYDKSLPVLGYVGEKNQGEGNAQYAQITSTSELPTTCGDTSGLVAEIIKNPTSADVDPTQPFVASVTVDSNRYVLELAASNCPKDPALLTKYQASLEHNFINLTVE